MKPFKFKQFTIKQERCAMKVGTDGVLLGAWTDLKNDPDSVLDIGAGTGVIALMLAQRSKAQLIDAIEIEEAAFEQCVENFEASPWADRLFCYHTGWDEFVPEINEKYDLIVSNPPFYSETVSSGDPSRDIARQSRLLPFDQLIVGVSKLLSKDGVFSTIIPFKKETHIIELASESNLFPNRITRVKGNPSSETKRSLVEFRSAKNDVVIDRLTIEYKRHRYTEEYTQLTKNFYLNM